MKNSVLVEIDDERAQQFAVLIDRCAFLTLKTLKQPHRKLAVNFTFLSEEEIETLNKTTRQKNEVTDVLSFPLLELTQTKKIKIKNFREDFDKTKKTLLLGDVCICFARAQDQAAEFGHSLEREVCYLAVHGLLHLLGFDHEEEGDKNMMRAVEEIVMRKVGLTR